MREWRHMCCAVDFSGPSRAAMHAAAELATRIGAELSLVHVVAPPSPGASDVLVSSRGVLDMAAQDAEAQLARWRAEAEEHLRRPVRGATLSGDAAREIIRHVRDEPCDLLVIGTHGRTGMARVLLGSVAEQVIRRSPCPVLVVREHEFLEREAALEEAAQYSGR